jgi:hypothetical protein
MNVFPHHPHVASALAGDRLTTLFGVSSMPVPSRLDLLGLNDRPDRTLCYRGGGRKKGVSPAFNSAPQLPFSKKALGGQP